MRIPNRIIFQANSKEMKHARSVCRDLAKMRGVPVGAFFTTSGALYEDNYSSPSQHGWVCAFEPSGKEIKICQPKAKN